MLCYVNLVPNPEGTENYCGYVPRRVSSQLTELISFTRLVIVDIQVRFEEVAILRMLRMVATPVMV